MRLIDASELKRSIAASAVVEDGKHIFDIIDDQPTIEERKTGKWVYNTPVTMKCDQCGFVIADWDFIKFKFCPNCGARMLEGDDHT